MGAERALLTVLLGPIVGKKGSKQETITPGGRLMSKPFRGSYTVAITPFTDDGSGIDTDALRKFIDWQVACDVPGIIMLGTTGEFLTISDDERREIVETTVGHVNGRIDVLVGTMNAYTPNAVRYSREAE